MSIKIVSLFDTCTECGETEDPSIGLFLQLNEKGVCSECAPTIDLHILIEKSRQCTAYLEGDDTANPENPDHNRNIYRAMDRAKDIAKACETYLDRLETLALKKKAGI